jgi:Chlorite dismutase
VFSYNYSIRYGYLDFKLLGLYGEVTMNTRFFEFVGGDTGIWQVVKTNTLVGESLLEVSRLDIASDSKIKPRPDASWVLRGITSNDRYVIREEKNELVSKQQGIGRPEATCAALIPIRKNENWWALTQDERRSIFDEHSNHIKIGLHYLPAVARRLHHCRDLSENEPFDFLTWFEFAPAHEAEFDQMLAELRASEEWKYIDREVDIRLTRET